MPVKIFSSVFLALVVVPAVLSLFVYDAQWWGTGITGGSVFMLPFLPLSFYYLPHALLFGEPSFVGGTGAGPAGSGELLVAGLYYSPVSLIITIIYRALKGDKERSSEPRGDPKISYETVQSSTPACQADRTRAERAPITSAVMCKPGQRTLICL